MNPRGQSARTSAGAVSRWMLAHLGPGLTPTVVAKFLSGKTKRAGKLQASYKLLWAILWPLVFLGLGLMLLLMLKKQISTLLRRVHDLHVSDVGLSFVAFKAQLSTEDAVIEGIRAMRQKTLDEVAATVSGALPSGLRSKGAAPPGGAPAADPTDALIDKTVLSCVNEAAKQQVAAEVLPRRAVAAAADVPDHVPPTALYRLRGTKLLWLTPDSRASSCMVSALRRVAVSVEVIVPVGAPLVTAADATRGRFKPKAKDWNAAVVEALNGDVDAGVAQYIALRKAGFTKPIVLYVWDPLGRAPAKRLTRFWRIEHIARGVIKPVATPATSAAAFVTMVAALQNRRQPR